MNWVKKKKLPAIEAIQYNGCLCIKLEDFWNILHNSFNSAQDQQINTNLLDEILDKDIMSWPFFLKAELIDAINKCNNSSTPEPDKLFWRHLKIIVKNKESIKKLIDITNSCINLGH